MSKNNVPACPTPAIDAAMERHRQYLLALGYAPLDVTRIENGLDPYVIPTLSNGTLPAAKLFGKPVVWIEATGTTARPRGILSGDN